MQGVQAKWAIMFPFSFTSDLGLLKNCVDNILSTKKPVFSVFSEEMKFRRKAA